MTGSIEANNGESLAPLARAGIRVARVGRFAVVDDLASGDWNNDFAFVREVGLPVLDIYPRLIRRHMHDAWTDEQRRPQLGKRGRYVEFTLLYVRGRRFGLVICSKPAASSGGTRSP